MILLSLRFDIFKNIKKRSKFSKCIFVISTNKYVLSTITLIYTTLLVIQYSIALRTIGHFYKVEGLKNETVMNVFYNNMTEEHMYGISIIITMIFIYLLIRVFFTPVIKLIKAFNKDTYLINVVFIDGQKKEELSLLRSSKDSLIFVDTKDSKCKYMQVIVYKNRIAYLEVYSKNRVVSNIVYNR